jgi:hypothetical protein
MKKRIWFFITFLAIIIKSYGQECLYKGYFDIGDSKFYLRASIIQDMSDKNGHIAIDLINQTRIDSIDSLKNEIKKNQLRINKINSTIQNSSQNTDSVMLLDELNRSLERAKIKLHKYHQNFVIEKLDENCLFFKLEFKKVMKYMLANSNSETLSKQTTDSLLYIKYIDLIEQSNSIKNQSINNINRATEIKALAETANIQSKNIARQEDVLIDSIEKATIDSILNPKNGTAKINQNKKTNIIKKQIEALKSQERKLFNRSTTLYDEAKALIKEAKELNISAISLKMDAEKIKLNLIKETNFDSIIDATANDLSLKLSYHYSLIETTIPEAGRIYIHKDIKIYDVSDLYQKRYCNNDKKNKIYNNDKKTIKQLRIRNLGRGNLRFKRDIKLIMWRSDTNNIYKYKHKYKKNNKTCNFTIKFIQFESSEGGLQDFIVTGKDENDEIINFTNSYPIPFSTKRNYSKLYKNILYNTNSAKTGKIYLIKMDDLMEYLPSLSVKSYDYSPFEDKYQINVENDDGKIVERTFYKEPVAKILQAKVFTDFVGFDKTQPNGLVQVEVSKPIYINHNYNSSFSVFRFFEPRLVFSKIENNDKAINLDTAFLINNQKEATTLDVFRYSNLSLGFNANAFTICLPRLKTFIEYNLLFYINRTAFLFPAIKSNDSSGKEIILEESYQKNYQSFCTGSDIRLKVRTDPRWGVNCGLIIRYCELYSDKIKQVEEKYHDRFFYSPYIEAYFKPESNSEFWFRGVFNKAFNTQDNFLQVQVGFTYSLSTVIKQKNNK